MILAAATAAPPNATDWITAGGTALAFVLAAVFGLMELRHRRRDRKERIEVEKRAQASKVNAWVRANYRERHDPRSDVLAVPVLHNGSGAPVYDMVVFVPSGLWQAGPLVWKRGLLLPSDEPESEVEPEMVDWPAGDRPLRFTFRDAAGLWWERNDEGLLKELAGKP